MGIIVGVDIGGTFTDVVGIDTKSFKEYTVKVPTTNNDHSVGFLKGIRELLNKMDGKVKDVTQIIHGTTVGTNAILEEKGAKIGILTTEGFEDTLEIGRQKRSNMYDLFLESETPTFLCPRKRRKGVKERIDPVTGESEIVVDEQKILESVKELVDVHNVNAIAVSYLYSFINPEHEKITERIIKENFPDLFISLSHQIDPNFREYERLCLTAFDAYIKPLINKYINKIENKLASENINAPIYIMLSQGGITGVKTLQEKSVGTLLSGVAAGVIGGKTAGLQSKENNVITLDVGGTSADVSLIVDGKSLIATESQIKSYPLRIPMVDINTIGAGGGSIAYLDNAQNLRVGPESASAVPGPVCYDRGGVDPTVTDASLILGYLNKKGLAGGTLPLNLQLANQIIDKKVATPLDMDIPEAAMGIHKITNAIMADAIRLVSVKKGYDPRKFSLVSFGGGGGLHACSVADQLGIKKIIVPAIPGVLSAEGLIMSNIETQDSMSFKVNLNYLDSSDLQDAISSLQKQCLERMIEYNVEKSNIKNELVLMMRYVGQSYEIPVSVNLRGSAEVNIEEIIQSFHDNHNQIYGHSDKANHIEIVSLRMTLSYPVIETKVVENLKPEVYKTPEVQMDNRDVYFDEYKKYIKTPVYNKVSFPSNKTIEGPLIVTQSDTTILVNPGWSILKHENGDMIMEKGVVNDIKEIERTTIKTSS